MKYTIDAADKKIGRIASEAASCLMGKKTVSFAKNNVADAQVHHRQEEAWRRRRRLCSLYRPQGRSEERDIRRAHKPPWHGGSLHSGRL